MRLFRIYFPPSVPALLASEIVLMFFCYVLAVILVVDFDPEIFLLYDGGLGRIGLMVAAMLTGLHFQDLYTNLRIRSKLLLVQQFCLVIGAAFLLQALLSYSKSSWVLPRWIMLIGSLCALVLLPAWRILYGRLVTSALAARRVLFLGTSPVAVDIARRFATRPELGMTCIGFVDDPQEPDDPLPDVPLLGPTAELHRIVAETNPDLIVVGLAERRQRLPMSALLDLRFSGIPIQEAAVAFENAFSRVCTRELRPSQLIFSSELGPQPGTARLQSVYSFALALLIALLTAPLLLLIAVLVKLTSAGPVFHRQLRVGLHGATFVLYKFRSMYADAEEKTGAVWASREDPRITPVGRILRRLRIDELPQLFNVLRGEMSIVGPRPERPEFVETLTREIPFYRQRHCVKPGITGWAQINHKYGDSLEDTIIKLEYDLYYIKNLAPALDAYIILNTLKVMLLARGAQ